MKLAIALISLALVGCGVAGEAGKPGERGKDGFNGADGGKTLQAQIRIVYEKYRQSVYRIAVQCDGAVHIFGSGFRIAEDTVATNKHVASYSCPGGKTKKFKIQAIGDNLDTLAEKSPTINSGCLEDSSYCVIASQYTLSDNKDLGKIKVLKRLKGESVEIDENNESARQVGRAQLSMSFPLAFEDLYTLTGTVSANHLGECDGGSGYGCPALDYDFITALDTDHGSSGSPIFDLQTTKVVGITTAGTEGANMSTTWAIFANRLNTFK